MKNPGARLLAAVAIYCVLAFYVKVTIGNNLKFRSKEMDNNSKHGGVRLYGEGLMNFCPIFLAR